MKLQVDQSLQTKPPYFDILPDLMVSDIGVQEDLGQPATRTSFFFESKQQLGRMHDRNQFSLMVLLLLKQIYVQFYYLSEHLETLLVSYVAWRGKRL